MWFKGETVILHERIQVGTDAFNAPVYEERPTPVNDVLIAPVTSTEAQEVLDLTGKKVVYQLGLPKGDGHVWEDRKVSFWGADWHVVGFGTQGMEAYIPGNHNRKVQVERYG